MGRKGRVCLRLTFAFLAVLAACPVEAASGPGIVLSVGEQGGLAAGLEIALLLTLLSLAPAALIALTSFVRLVIVLSFLRQAVGTHTMPPNQVIVSLALFMTLFIMAPTFRQIYGDAVQPYLEEEVEVGEALERAFAPLRRFMLRQTREKDLGLFLRLRQDEMPEGPEELPPEVVVPAFLISELKTAFQMGFLIYIPFLVIDMAVASILLSMGMMMLPPVLISLPFKLMLFVLVDGWNVLVTSLVRSFR